jgi:hypothetical protein
MRLMMTVAVEVGCVNKRVRLAALLPGCLGALVWPEAFTVIFAALIIRLQHRFPYQTVTSQASTLLNAITSSGLLFFSFQFELVMKYDIFSTSSVGIVSQMRRLLKGYTVEHSSITFL